MLGHWCSRLYNIAVSRRHIPAKPDYTAKNDRMILCQINVRPASLQQTNKHWVDVSCLMSTSWQIHETSASCYFNVGPASQTVDQQYWRNAVGLIVKLLQVPLFFS